MTIATWLYTLFAGAKVGRDGFGNRYYRDRFGARRFDGRREKRWVLYRGTPEASKVPPEWHAWLHQIVDAPPRADRPVRPWQRPHEPNRTGTPEAYRPPGHDFKGGARAKATGDYEAWTPPS